VAIAVGLRTAAGASVTGIEETAIRALVKLEQVLPARLRPRLRALQSATTIQVGGPTVDPHSQTINGAAARDSERVRFAYSDSEGYETRREAEPHTLVNRGRRWYVVAWDLGREDWRSFRLDRIARPAATGVRFRQRELPAKDAGAFLTQSIKTMPNRYEAVLILHAPAAEIRKRFGAGWGRLEEIDARSCRWRTGDDDLDWLAVRALMLGVDLDVIEPPELAEHLAALGARASRAAGEFRG
jgi:predicted DNA-binding transcriptional regulator YafY